MPKPVTAAMAPAATETMTASASNHMTACEGFSHLKRHNTEDAETAEAAEYIQLEFSANSATPRQLLGAP